MTTTAIDITEASVYVGTYAKYNSGSLEGKWVTLSNFVDYDDFIEYCKELHSDEEDPEFMFQDYENIPGSLASESELNPVIWDIIGWSDFEEAYQGEYDSEEDFAYELYNDIYKIPDFISNYVDWEKVARDLFMCDYEFINGHVFRVL